ncbi:MAG: cold shock domain-containing protein [Verrucomicrobiales bacterium]|nr:cold shock domain-containing protein [Verrucomicrobiales bacterium]
MPAERLIGEVVFFTDYRGYGFIRSGRTEYFVHTSTIHQLGNASLDPGARVEFTPREGRKGPMAIDVRVLASADIDPADSERWVFMKTNPFTPQDPVVDPRRFAGRRDHFHNAVDALYNSKNILITGPRGMGKSSICYQLLYLASGDNTLAEKLGIDLGGESLNRLTGDHRCTPGNTVVDVSTSLLTTLQANLGEHMRLKGRETDYNVDLKYFKFGQKESLEPLSTGDLATMFAIDIDRVFKAIGGDASGITFLIDEVDVLLEDVDLAPFLKATIERLRLNHHLSVSFIIGGVTGSATNLLIQHPSAGRLFENIAIGPMQNGELSEIIDLCLEGTGVEITEHAKNKVVGLANNFPQPVHLIGYHAFRLDADAFIDVDDVDRAKGFVVTNLKKQEFQERFEQLIQGGSLDVTRVLALSKYETVNMGYFKRLVQKMSLHAISSALGELERHAIIEQQTSGVWRFTDPLFKVYLRWALGIDDVEAGRQRGRQGSRRRSGSNHRHSDRRDFGVEKNQPNNPRQGNR